MSEDFDSHWVEMNNSTIREERIRTALNTAAWALAILASCTAIAIVANLIFMS